MSQDYEGKESQDSEKKGSSSSSYALVIVLCVVGVLMVLGVVAVVVIAVVITLGQNASGTFGFVATKVSSGGSGPVDDDRTTAKEAARQFLEDSIAGRHDAAYNRTTKFFRSGTERQEFSAYLRDHRIQDQWVVEDLKCDEPEFIKADCSATLTKQSARRHIRLKLVKEDGQWKVDSVD